MTLLDVALVNAGTATLLGVAVAAITRFVRRPEVAHALWLAVLLDLLAPPVIVLALLPAPAPAPVPDAGAPAGVVTAAEPALTMPRSRDALPWLWLAGSMGVVILAVARATRFRRVLADSRAPSPELARRAAELAATAGLRRPPTLRIVGATVPPHVWPTVGPAEIVFPAGLLARLEPRERDALLLHELAHVRRRDTWVRFAELAATAAFWWHPLVFAARRALRRAEERSCDGWVTRLLSDHPVDYARALVKTAEFLAGPRRGTPALASGAGDFRHIEERLTMILDQRPPRLLRPWTRWALGLAVAATLLAFPTWGDAPDAEATPVGDDPRLEELEREARELDARRAEIAADMERLRAGATRRSLARSAPGDAAAYREARALARRMQVEAEALQVARARGDEERTREALDLAREELERARAGDSPEQAAQRAAEVRRAAEEIAKVRGDAAGRSRADAIRRLEGQAERLKLALEEVERARRRLEEREPRE